MTRNELQRLNRFPHRDDLIVDVEAAEKAILDALLELSGKYPQVDFMDLDITSETTGYGARTPIRLAIDFQIKS